MTAMVSFWVNGRLVESEKNKNLLDFLRDDLKLTGAKRGCGTGHCGACTVLLDGKAVRSCRILLEKVKGKKVETIESLLSDDGLHPIQKAFLDTGAVQCGFCTPGMIMSVKALLDNNLSPTMEDIKKALSPNICRCTGYKKNY